MTKDSLMNMLQTLCMYNNVEIKHTFSSDDDSLITVRCLENTTTIEVVILSNHTVILYDDLEEAAQDLHHFIQEHSCV